jgi:molybdopterin biosynthesis enzyme
VRAAGVLAKGRMFDMPVLGLPIQPASILSHFRQILDFVFISCLILAELDIQYLRAILNAFFTNSYRN